MTKIKAVIFDLDDTLFDCTGQLVEAARKRSAEAMAKYMNATADEIYKKIVELETQLGPKSQAFDKVCEIFKPEKEKDCVTAALQAYNADTVEEISLFPDAIPLFRKLKKNRVKLILVTSGVYSRQIKKIELLGLEKWMDLILVHDIEKGVSKEVLFEQALKQFSLKPEEAVAIGDRVHSEIKFGNKMGMATVQMLHGRYKKVLPKHSFEEPDFKISKLKELPGIIRLIERGRNHKPKIVAIGGGTGLPVVLNALKDFTPNLTAIVTVTDSGRSSGSLRKDLAILPPGDIRNCLIALSDSEELMKKLFMYRFKKGKLADQSFGNLFIAALAKTTGSFEKALKQVSQILRIRGRVLPSTLEDTHLYTELEDGTFFESEDELIQRHVSPKEISKRAPIKQVYLKPKSAKIIPEAKKAIAEADMIVLGPGSLYTSVITNLLVKGMCTAIKKSRAKKVFIVNVMTQVNQTHNYSLSMQVKAIEKYLGKNILDFVVYNTKKPNKTLLKRYEKEQSFPIKNDLQNLKGIKARLLGTDLIEMPKLKTQKITKQQLLRHDSKKIGKILVRAFSQ